jgi:hypothetical protein
LKLTLEAWASAQFDPPPKIGTLRAWAKSGRIVPEPVKVGRTWMVDAWAQYCPTQAAVNTEGLSSRAAAILMAA